MAGKRGSRTPRVKGKHVGFKKLKRQLTTKGAKNPGALAAHIGRKKYGAAGMAALAAAGRKKNRRGR